MSEGLAHPWPQALGIPVCMGGSLGDVLGSQMSLHLGLLSMGETEPHASVAWGTSCFSLPTPVCEGVPALREANLHSHLQPPHDWSKG